ncbi:MAG TPA: DHA2 family efflux MFS transporter permease subunit [Stellaceae bacterium]|nr:DHA2 family efflux MFS transporter permease subunit [Stellaceae bacterium]
MTMAFKGAGTGTRRDWIGFGAMCIGMFMAVLDIQIVATALPDLQAALKIPFDYLSWTQTAYLIPEIIAVALSGWAGRLITHGRLFALGAAGFTLASIGCAFSGDAVTLISWRVAQGLCGGFLIPTVFTVGARLFDGRAEARAIAAAGAAAMLATAIGPLVAGYIVEQLSWHWLFLINVLPGIVVVATVSTTIKLDAADRSALSDFEAVAFVSLVGFLVALELLLKEGPPRGWADSVVFGLVALVVVSTAGLWLRCVKRRSALLEMRLLRDSRFALACLASFVLGIGVFGSAYLLPVFLGFVRQHSPLEIGETVMVTGAAQLVCAPIAAWVQARWGCRTLPGALIATAGFACFALGSLLNAHETVNSDFRELLLPQVLRGAAVMFCLLPTMAMALDHQRADQLGNASALFNLVRNVGGAVGIALVATVIELRPAVHAHAIAARLQAGDRATAQFLGLPLDRFHGVPIGPVDQATQDMVRPIIEQGAATASFNDAWIVVAIAFAATAVSLAVFAWRFGTARTRATGRSPIPQG